MTQKLKIDFLFVFIQSLNKLPNLFLFFVSEAFNGMFVCPFPCFRSVLFVQKLSYKNASELMLKY